MGIQAIYANRFLKGIHYVVMQQSRPDLLDDPRFASVPLRSDNRRPLGDEIEKELAKWDSEDLVAKLEAAKVPACFVNNYEQVFADPQSVHRGLAVAQPHPYAADLKLVANPVRYSETPLDFYRAPPLLGEHSNEILIEKLGMDLGSIEDMRARKIIQ